MRFIVFLAASLCYGQAINLLQIQGSSSAQGSSVLFATGTNARLLGQDTSHFSYNSSTHTLSVTNEVLTNPLPVIYGGSGTATPALVAGTNVTITGSWPNQTISATGIGGGTVTHTCGALTSGVAVNGNGGGDICPFSALTYSSTGTAQLFDQTLTTGTSQLLIRNGVAQGSTSIPFQVQDNSGNTLASIDYLGQFSSVQIISQNGSNIGSSLNGATSYGVSLSSNKGICWSSTTVWFASPDTCASRFAAGGIAAGNGTLGDASGFFEAAIFQSSTAAVAAAGTLRLASTDSIHWRNAGGTSDVVLAKNTSDQFTISGPLIPSSPATQSIGTVTNPFLSVATGLVGNDVGTAIASATTIAPTASITHITGTTPIATITAPALFIGTGRGGCITLVPDGAWTTTTAGNISVALTASVGQAIKFCYDGTHWNPSGTGASVAAGTGIAISTTSGVSTISTDATIATKAGVQLNTARIVTLTSASGSTLTGTQNPTLTAYGDQQQISFTWNQACTGGAMTIAVDGLAATSLVKADGTSNLVASDCPNGQTNFFSYDGTLGKFKLMGGGKNLPSIQDCGTTSTCSATLLNGGQIVKGSAPLVSGTPSTVTITGISPAFTSSASYVCALGSQSTLTAPPSVANVSGSSFTITGPASSTAVINYVCAGN